MVEDDQKVMYMLVFKRDIPTLCIVAMVGVRIRGVCF
jgi:hypothetical protein